MKKLLGISLVAVLAATPLMAGAADLTPEQLAHGAIVQANGDNPGDTAKMATVSYVKGAYTELGNAINTKADKSALTAEETRAKGIESGLQSAINTLNGDENTEGSVDKKIADAISEVNTAAADLEDRVEANEGAITKLNGNDQTVGSVAYAVAQEASARATAVSNEATTRSTEDTRLEGLIDAEEAARIAADGVLTTLNEGLSQTNLVSAINSENTRAKQAESNLQTAINNLNTGANTTYAKKVGVTQTITDSTISGTVPVVTDWASQTEGTVAINARITGAAYNEPTE